MGILRSGRSRSRPMVPRGVAMAERPQCAAGRHRSPWQRELRRRHHADERKADLTDVFKSAVYTGGINYYIQGNTKIQANYNVVNNPDARAPFVFHNVRNNSFVVNFQVAF